VGRVAEPLRGGGLLPVLRGPHARRGLRLPRRRLAVPGRPGGGRGRGRGRAVGEGRP
jgi:hypothetical protein